MRVQHIHSDHKGQANVVAASFVNLGGYFMNCAFLTRRNVFERRPKLGYQPNIGIFATIESKVLWIAGAHIS